jgi:phosphohistidine swiveling domain-containing protein
MKLKGTVACNSVMKITGVANIVNENSAIFKKGNILIAKSTSPDYLKFMKNSKAIITECGGLLSHAAIVSRELRIPCIVGVKEVIKKIRTGDKLKLNLENGTIEIIER